MEITNIVVSINYEDSLDYSADIQVGIGNKDVNFHYAKDSLKIGEENEKNLIALVETIKSMVLKNIQNDLTINN